jgi:hypothetical protein
MVVQRRTLDYLTSPEFQETRDFLESFGLPPRPVHEYFLDDVLHAISRKPWEVEFEEEVDPPGWKAAIREWRHVTQSRTAIGRDRDKVMALLRAVRLALAWPTPEDEKQAFDEQTRSLLGISADEFMQQWLDNRLSADDPRVGHLLVVRPLGW